MTSPDVRPQEDAELEQALQQILRLLDVTRDIERNEDDADFAAAGGTFHYVFDENVFEMFVRPHLWQERTATFYSHLWLDPNTERLPGAWTAIAGQSALLASEYLLSGKLPGQREPQIYVTEWHLWELRARLDHIAGQLRQRAQEALKNDRDLHRTPRKPPFLKDDLEQLRDHPARWTREAIDRFITTRVAVAELAADKLLEPLEQLRRIMTEPIRSQIANLDELFPVPPTDYGIIAADARKWRDLLADEQSLRAPGGGEPVRKSFNNDAQALAYLQWAARKCAGTAQRLVFVTGDTILFDAYRRWHSRIDPRSDEYRQPFALRRLVQYAPIFNMNDAMGDISEARELFERTRAAVEVALLPFNLSQMDASGKQLEQINRGREFMALQLAHVRVLSNNPIFRLFTRGISPAWLNENNTRLRDITGLWQRTERIAIGSMYESVLPRLDRAQRRRMIRRGAEGGDALRPALTGYVGELLDRIVEDSVKLWMPLAVRFITRNLAAALAATTAAARPPIYLDLRDYHADLPLDWSDLPALVVADTHPVRKLLENAGDEFAERPEILFAVACTFALLLGFWSNAERFAELAMKCGALPDAEAEPSSEKEEFLYLHALTKRFGIGDMSPVRGEGALRAVRNAYAEARQLLNRCEAALSGADAETAIKRIRILSERAALNLFYFAAGMLSPRDSIRNGFAADGTAGDALARAEADLSACLAYELDDAQHLPDAQRAALDRIRRQFLSNVAAVTVLRTITGFGEPAALLVSDAAVERVVPLLETDPRLPEISKLDIAAYVLIAAKPPQPRADEVVALAQRLSVAQSLSLDTATAKAIVHWAGKRRRALAAGQTRT